MSHLFSLFIQRNLIDTKIQELANQGFTLLESIFDPLYLQNLSNHVDKLYEHNLMHPSLIGRKNKLQSISEVRGDFISWIDQKTQNPVESDIHSFLEQLKNNLKQELFLPLKRFECHWAYYPAGSHYDVHLDQHPGQPYRVITFVIYLNQNWSPADGGELRIYSKDMTHLVDVLPQMGNMILFQSDLFPHEVLLSNAPRKTLTGWFRIDDSLF